MFFFMRCFHFRYLYIFASKYLLILRFCIKSLKIQLYLIISTANLAVRQMPHCTLSGYCYCYSLKIIFGVEVYSMLKQEAREVNKCLTSFMEDPLNEFCKPHKIIQLLCHICSTLVRGPKAAHWSY
jgi:hypothetical protein